MNKKFTVHICAAFLGIILFSSSSFCTNHTITVQNFSFSPSSVDVSVGDTVTWQWVNGSHTTTCDGTHPGTSLPPGAVAWDQQMNSTNTSFSYIVSVEGEYDYICLIHYPNMFGVITATPLPVELVSFTGILSGDIVNLKWQTATEKNNNGFEVQRKSGNSWENIGFIKGHGTTTKKNYYTFNDNISEIQRNEIHYRLNQIDFSGSHEYSAEVIINKSVPSEYNLAQNYPNPFNPNTQINYSIPQTSSVILKVFDVLGDEVATLVNDRQAAGNYRVEFNASKFSSGIYYYSLTAGSFTSTKKMILLK